MLGNKHGQVSHQSYQGSSSGDENAPIQVEIKLDLQRAIQLLNREKRRADDEAEVIALLRMELERERRNKGLPTEEEYQIELQRIIEKEKRTFKKEMDILRNEISVLQTALIEENQKKEKALQDVYILAELKQNTELQLQKAVTNRKNVEQRTTNEKEKCLAIESERDAAVISSEKEKQKAIILETEIEQLNEKIQQKEQELLKVLQERQIEQRLTAETLDEIQSERKRQDDQNDALQQNVSELKQQIELIGKQHENEKKNLYNQIREELEKQIPEEQQNEIDELRKAIQETSQELRELRQQYEDEKFNRERADNQKKEVEDQLETMRKDMEKLINYADEYKEKEDELNQELNNIKQKYDQLSKESQAMEKTMSQSYRQLQETTSQQLQAQSEKSIEIQRENDRLKSEMKKIEQNEVQYQKEIGQTKKENSIQKQEKEKEWLKREQQLQSEIDKLIGENEDMKKEIDDTFKIGKEFSELINEIMQGRKENGKEEENQSQERTNYENKYSPSKSSPSISLKNQNMSSSTPLIMQQSPYSSQQKQYQSSPSLELNKLSSQLSSSLSQQLSYSSQQQSFPRISNQLRNQLNEFIMLREENTLMNIQLSTLQSQLQQEQIQKSGTQYELTEEKKKKEEERWAIMRERERMKDEIRLKDEQILSIMKDNEQQNKDKERMNNEIIEREMKYQEDKQKEEEEIIKLEDLIEQKEREVKKLTNEIQRLQQQLIKNENTQKEIEEVKRIDDNKKNMIINALQEENKTLQNGLNIFKYELQKREDRVKLLEKQIDGEKEKGIKERKEKTNYEIEAIAIRREKYELQDAFEREREQQENDKRKIMEMREEELKQKEEEKLKLLEYVNDIERQKERAKQIEEERIQREMDIKQKQQIEQMLNQQRMIKAQALNQMFPSDPISCPSKQLPLSVTDVDGYDSEKEELQKKRKEQEEKEKQNKIQLQKSERLNKRYFAQLRREQKKKERQERINKGENIQNEDEDQEDQDQDQEEEDYSDGQIEQQDLLIQRMKQRLIGQNYTSISPPKIGLNNQDKRNILNKEQQKQQQLSESQLISYPFLSQNQTYTSQSQRSLTQSASSIQTPPQLLIQQQQQNERSKPVIQSNARARLAELLRTPAIFYPEERRQNININQRSVVNSGINPRTSLIGANLQSQISISPPPHTSETSPIHKSPHNSPPRPTQFPITLDSTQTITIKTSPESKNTFVRTITSSPSHINMNYDNLNSNIDNYPNQHIQKLQQLQQISQIYFGKDKERGRSIDKIGSNVRTSPERSEISNENRKVSFSSSYTTGGSKNISQIRSLSPSNSISQNQQSPIHKSPHNSPPRPTQFPITLDSTQTITIKTSPESKNTFVRTITSSPSHINMNYDNLNSNIAGSPKFNNQQQFGKDKERGRSIDRIGSIVRTSPERSDILNENRKVTFSSQYATTGGSTSSIQLQQVYSPFSTVVGSVQQKQVTSTLFFNKPISLSSPPRSYSQPSYQQQSYNYQSTLQQQSSPHMSHPLKAPDSPKKPEFDKLKPSNPHDE